jgi:hypothetical protein
MMFAAGLMIISFSSAAGCLPTLPTLPRCSPTCESDGCCHGMGGIHFCDATAGRYVCKNGFYSSCYCTRHAVMDLQEVQGCCLWQGGVMAVTPNDIVLCNDGGFSESCSILRHPQHY